MALYGNDIDESVTPFEARLGFAVEMGKEAFIGRNALASQKAAGVDKLRVGFRMIDRAIPRKACKVWDEDEEVGWVTSGSLSPLLIILKAVASSILIHASKENAVSDEPSPKERVAESDMATL